MENSPPNHTPSGLERFIGGTPLGVIVRLIVLSLIVGLLLSAFDLQPLDLVDRIFVFFQRAFLGIFNSLEDFLSYILLGAVLVVPIWFILRILKMRS